MSNASDFIIENGVLTKYVGNDSNVQIPDGVKVIGDHTFYCCYDIERIDAPNSVEHIGRYAFNTCPKLSIFFYGDADVGEKAFDGIACVTAPNLSFSCFDTTNAKRAAILGYFENMTAFSNMQVVEEYQKYIVSQRKKLLPDILKNDLVDLIALYAEKKKITVANFEEEYLSPAAKVNATNCVSFLMNWKAQNISVDMVEKHIENELEKDPCNAADMKKIWSYEKCSGGITLTGYKGKETVVEVPQCIGNDAVVMLDDGVFGPKTKKGVAKAAGCLKVLKAITKISIPDGIKTIGNSAFERCEKLECVNIPNSVTSIGWRAFCDCHSLKKIEIPANVAELKAKTFQHCKSLETIVLSEGLLKIGNDAFDGCEKLKSLILPNTLTSMGMQACFDCSSLTQVKLSSLNGIGVGTFTACGELERIEIPESVSRIGKNAFQLCKKLCVVKMTAKTKEIDDQTFNRCENLVIYAPAGSYVEEYAKKNNIPFVAEE